MNSQAPDTQDDICSELPCNSAKRDYNRTGDESRKPLLDSPQAGDSQLGCELLICVFWIFCCPCAFFWCIYSAICKELQAKAVQEETHPILQDEEPEVHANVDNRLPAPAQLSDLVYDLPPNYHIQINSMVIYDQHIPGVVKLIFRDKTSDDPTSFLVAMEVEAVDLPGCTAGVYRGLHIVPAARKNILFCLLNKCELDRRFQKNVNHSITEEKIPLAHRRETERQYPSKKLEGTCGLWKGIQGDINSCYMDSTLFSMFAFSDSFDSLLQPKPGAEEMSNVLREGVIYPLRKYGHVASETMHEMRNLLDGLGKVKGITDHEKDPEEFINLLLNDVFKCTSLIQLSTNQTCNTLSLVGDKDETTPVPTAQRLLERFCLQEKIKFEKTPKCLILQMPRFGKDYKIYDRIFPDLSIDLTHLLADSQRMCHVCGGAAEVECPGCFDEQRTIRAITFCKSCDQEQHKPETRKGHVHRLIKAYDQQSQSDHKLELSSVLCIDTSHYVSFCKTAAVDEAPWVFFDSMAQREDEINMPEVTKVCDALHWLSRQGYEELCQGEEPPPLLRRLFKDIYICIYCATGQIARI